MRVKASTQITFGRRYFAGKSKHTNLITFGGCYFAGKSKHTQTLLRLRGATLRVKKQAHTNLITIIPLVKPLAWRYNSSMKTSVPTSHVTIFLPNDTNCLSRQCSLNESVHTTHEAIFFFL
jgi:hypothetical protein